MGEEPQVPGDWDPSGSGEPPAQLLRRAISHVESLLHRLEPAVEAADTETPTPPVAVAESAPAKARPATPEPEPEPVAPVVDATRFTPLSTVSSAEKAEALRITLHAHEEAHRLQSEANALRAAAAADGEHMLLEARTMSDRVHVEARESATALLEAAQRESRALLEAARAEATSIRQRAVADHDSRRAEYDALAAQERAAAVDEANVIVEQAEREARQIRADAHEAGRADAIRDAQQQVAGAVAEVRNTMHALLDQVRESLATFDDAVRCIEPQIEEPMPSGPAAVPTMPSVPAALADDDETDEHDVGHDVDDSAVEPEATTPEPPERRPLGLLFRAQR